MFKKTRLTEEQIADQGKRWARFRRQCKKRLALAPADQKRQDAKMQWWREARFGMFIHFGLYSVLGRHEWAMNLERWPAKDYAKLAQEFTPKPGAIRSWAKLARQAGMKYMVLTAKHHEGFCLWDTKQTDFNAVQLGPKRDLIAEYVSACRAEGLKVGLYYSLMDWHHPDGACCVYDGAARKRFVRFTTDCLGELMSNYGQIDVLWYDVPWPLSGAKAWNAAGFNGMIRRLQPQIIINDRSWQVADYCTCEEEIRPPAPGRDWEACMTLNGSWGYMPSAIMDHASARDAVGRLAKVTAGAGNLLLNIGPAPDGSVPPESRRELKIVGDWLAKNGEPVYGNVDRVEGMEWQATGSWTARGNVRYFWCNRWAGSELIFGGIKTKVKKITLLATGRPVKFTQDAHHVVITGLPKTCPDPKTGWAVLRVEFARNPQQFRGAGCVYIQ